MPASRPDRVRALVVGALLTILVLLALETTDPDAAWPMVGIVTLIGLALIVPTDPESWRALFAGVKSASVGPVALEFFDRVLANAPPDDEPVRGEDRVDSALELRMSLEHKLAFIVKHMLPRYEGGSTFATVGSLKYDGYLAPEEAEIAAGLLAMRDEDLHALSEAKRKAVLDAADRTVGRIRASVLHGLVKKELKRLEWNFKVIPRKARDDLYAYKYGTAVRIATVFAERRDSDLTARLRDRLGAIDSREGELDQRLIVLPDTADLELEPADRDPRVIRLRHLPRALADAERRRLNARSPG